LKNNAASSSNTLSLSSTTAVAVTNKRTNERTTLSSLSLQNSLTTIKQNKKNLIIKKKWVKIVQMGVVINHVVYVVHILYHHLMYFGNMDVVHVNSGYLVFLKLCGWLPGVIYASCVITTDDGRD
jgi:hypothetical protein